MWNPLPGRMKRLSPAIGLILMYHRVNEAGMDPWALCVTPEHFAEHLEIIQKQAHPVSLAKLVEETQNHHIPSSPFVAVTFDDGYRDNLLYAKPLLEQFDIPATFFITTDNIGSDREFWWDELEHLLLQPGELPRELSLEVNGERHHWDLGKAANYSVDEYRRDFHLKAWQGQPGTRHFLFYSVWKRLQPLPEKERSKLIGEIARWANDTVNRRESHRTLVLSELQDLGSGDLIEIGAHTVTHPPLSTQPILRQEEEIWKSKEYLETVLERPLLSFAYPHGDYSGETIRILQSAGFTCACTTREEPVRLQQYSFELPRVHMTDRDGDMFSKQFREWFTK